MKTIAAIFKTFGGPAVMGRAMGVTTEHAATMQRRNSIPVRYWPALLSYARDHKINLTEADLIAVHSKHSGTAA